MNVHTWKCCGHLITWQVRTIDVRIWLFFSVTSCALIIYLYSSAHSLLLIVLELYVITHQTNLACRFFSNDWTERFKVLSYNILADYLALDHRSKLYFHIPEYMLDWQWRKRNIIFELGLWSADIMCLQVCDQLCHPCSNMLI